LEKKISNPFAREKSNVIATYSILADFVSLALELPQHERISLLSWWSSPLLVA